MQSQGITSQSTSMPKYVRLLRTIEADAGKGLLRLGPGAFEWELLEVADHGAGDVAYLRSNPAGVIYTTDELDALACLRGHSVSVPRPPKQRWRVGCMSCPWYGDRRQRLKEHAEANSCPQCGEPVHARVMRQRRCAVSEHGPIDNGAAIEAVARRDGRS